MYFTLSSQLAGLKNIERLLEGPLVLGLPIGSSEDKVMVGWGKKPSHKWALRYAKFRSLSCLSLEDGFLRSVGLGQDEPPLSIVLDDLGIYYDASGPSRLELQIASTHSTEQYIRARGLLNRWREGRLSKYNHGREADPFQIVKHPYVLVADQTLGDASIHYGSSNLSSFRQMLDAALEENPHHQVLLKVHPEVMSGRKQGHYDLRALSRFSRVKVIEQAVHPVSLIEHAAAVYTVSSQLGFEGLLWGKRVRTFGMPFYAGWGLTVDEQPSPARRKPVALEDLVHAALVEYPRYIDPESLQRCEVERLIEWMTLQRRMRERFPPVVYAKGFSIWKKPIVRKFFQGSEVKFLAGNKSVPQQGKLVVWGSQLSNSLSGVKDPEPSRSKADSTIHLEDGFLRSVGLGRDLAQPLSWVMDYRGIYYDSSRPSDLEHVLQHASFDDALLERAAGLRQRIVMLGVTKYNIDRQRSWQRPARAERVILVPGQVETDASIACGAPEINKNIELLRAVKAANPQSYIVYKPHPDVVAGLRSGGLGEGEADTWCDEQVTDCAMSDLLEKVDEVHVMTSLAGFEALLRRRKVVTYGQPFYSGWGMTEDKIPLARRTRRLSLDELTAGVLILYPTYISRSTNRFTTPEHVIDELIAWQKNEPLILTPWRKLIRAYLKMAKP